MDQDTQHLMASHQFLLSGEVGVTTSATTYDKRDEALVKVVRLCSSLKPLDIKCGGRWTETESGASGRREGDKEPPWLQNDRSGRAERRGVRGANGLHLSWNAGREEQRWAFGRRGSKQTYDLEIASWH